MKNEAQNSLKVLSVFHYLMSLQLIVSGLFVFPYILAGIIGFVETLKDSTVQVSNSESFSNWGDVVAILALYLAFWILTVSIVLMGRKLAKQKSRRFCLIVAFIESFMFPLGTILGITTLFILTKNTTKNNFKETPSKPIV